VRSGGASASLAGRGRWARGRGSTVVARSLLHEKERERREREEEDEGNGVNPTPAHSIYKGVYRIYPLRLLAPYNTP
jgi:hypothetical protein